MAETTGESHPTVVIGSRSWSHLVPLLTGVVKPVGFDLDLRSLSSTPDLHAHPELDGSEMSFSRYARARSEGDDRLVGLPAFVMRAFRHRCILVRSDSDLVDLRQLSGCTVGLTGWPDSGNTWTRSLLTRAGVEIDSVKWWLAPVASGDAPKPHDVRALPANVRVAEPGQYLLGALADGSLDAIMTPFTPAALKASDGDFRHLLEDFPAAEASYYRDMGFVPGIHIVALRQEVVDTHPWLPAAVVETLE
ncbi:MAG: hypothetical protein ACRDQA_30570, partial [Nocardioidaceae bacterium]